MSAYPTFDAATLEAASLRFACFEALAMASEAAAAGDTDKAIRCFDVSVKLYRQMRQPAERLSIFLIEQIGPIQ